MSLEIGASDEGWLHQTDTYFQVPQGRLKLREEGPVAQLIFYERANETVARESRYRLVPVSDPTGLKDALSDALGVLIVVEKSRRLLLWHGFASTSMRFVALAASSRLRRWQIQHRI